MRNEIGKQRKFRRVFKKVIIEIVINIYLFKWTKKFRTYDYNINVFDNISRALMPIPGCEIKLKNSNCIYLLRQVVTLRIFLQIAKIFIVTLGREAFIENSNKTAATVFWCETIFCWPNISWYDRGYSCCLDCRNIEN